MRSGGQASGDLDHLRPVAASLSHRAEIVLVPPSVRAVVTFKPA